jgi:hypothetical protein
MEQDPARPLGGIVGAVHVTEILVFLGLAALAAGLFLGPLIPAFLEMRTPRGRTSLLIPADHDADVRYFAWRFREFVFTEHGPLPSRGAIEYVPRDAPAHRAIVASDPLVVHAHTEIDADIYARSSVVGGEGATYRGLLAEGPIQLGSHSLLLRWMHGTDDVSIEEESSLLGRASAEMSLCVGRGAPFGWLSAPRIEFGGRERGAGPQADHTEDGAPRLAPNGFRRVIGDLEVPPESEIADNLVVTRALRIGARSVIRGSIKSHGPLHVGDGVHVAGNVVSRDAISIGRHCVVDGIVVAERSVCVDEHTRIGSAGSPSTVSAPFIEIAPGAIAFGTVWARKRGEVCRPASG